MKSEDIKKTVRDGYGEIALRGGSCCEPKKTCGCTTAAEVVGKAIGYTDEQMGQVPEGANMGLGCGNPTAIASLKKGEVVLDLGSGGGFDCFLAANVVGETGRVIGVDMTAEMLERARENAAKGNYKNVEFRLGEIENLPVADNSVDVVISNCVINLSPDKGRVFQEAHRVLKPGGRLMVSDIMLLKELPVEVKSSVAAYVGCVSGAISKQDYLASVETAGFKEVEIVSETFVKWMSDDPSIKAMAEDFGVSQEILDEVADAIVSINVRAVKAD